MILPDVNVLIHAINKDSSKHDKIRRWWEDVLSGMVTVYMPWVVILGFIRISTNRKIFQSPLSVQEACAYVQEWLHRPCVRIAESREGHWEIVKKMLQETRNGELTTDAHLAALAIQLDCVLYSTDTDYKRFPGLKWEYFKATPFLCRQTNCLKKLNRCMTSSYMQALERIPSIHQT